MRRAGLRPRLRRSAIRAAATSANREIIRDLVLANHILANEGVLDAYGHVSVRDDVNPRHFLLSRSLPPSEVTAADILEYDSGRASRFSPTRRRRIQERFIHSEIYRARPDVKAIVHCHTGDLIPFGVTGTRLLPVIHMAGFLGDGIPTFRNSHRSRDELTCWSKSRSWAKHWPTTLGAEACRADARSWRGGYGSGSA